MELERREFTEFYEAARDDCLRVVLITVGDRDLAEDLVAEAFTRAWRAWRTVRQHPAARAWIVRTALNTHVSWWRRQRREITLADQDDRAAASPQLAAWTVHINPGGTVSFRLRNTSHPAQLQRALAKAGVPAVVSWGKICEAGGPGQALMDTQSFFKPDSPLAQGAASWFAVQGGTNPNVDLNWSWTIIPSKIPHGGHFVISAVPGKIPVSDSQAVWEFAHTSAPLTCARLMKA